MIEKDPLNLKRCIRLYPHDDNQGGFFVALFVRLGDHDKKIDGDMGDAWNNSKIR